MSKEKLLKELNHIIQECSEPNWDAYGALPVDKDSIERVKKMIDMLPEGFPNPELGIDPDGEITFEWYKSRRETINLWGSRNGFCYCAYLQNDKSSHGREPMSDFKIPVVLQELIKSILS